MKLSLAIHIICVITFGVTVTPSASFSFSSSHWSTKTKSHPNILYNGINIGGGAGQSTSRATLTKLGSVAENENSAAEKLLEKAAQLRAEIAKLEGKTVEQVEQEAKQKKELIEEAKQKSREVMATATPFDKGRMLSIPESTDQMIAQAARAIEMAYRDGMKRQTIRLALVAEGELFSQDNQWPGGTQQMYREAAKPLTKDLLKQLRVYSHTTGSDHRLPPNVVDQEIWDFDGSALLTAEAQEGAAYDVQALVFANTDVKYINDINNIDQAMGDRLFLLVNPFWKNVDSWGMNLLAPGAKKKAQATIFDKGYEETYVFSRFSVRGEFCAAIKCYPYDWQLFAYLEHDNGWDIPIRLGSCEIEPTSAIFTQLLNEREEFKLTKIMRQLQKK